MNYTAGFEWITLLLPILGIYLLYSSIAKAVVTEGEDTRKPPPLYRPLKFLIGLGLMVLSYSIIVEGWGSTPQDNVASGRSDSRYNRGYLKSVPPSSTPVSRDPAPIRAGGNNSLLSELDQLVNFRLPEKDSALTEARNILVEDGRRLSVAFQGETAIRPLADYPRLVVDQLENMLVAESGNADLYNKDPLSNFRDYPEGAVTTHWIRQNVKSRIKDNLYSINTQVLPHEARADDLQATVRFWLENDESTKGFPGILSLTEKVRGNYSGASEVPVELEKLLSLALRYTIEFTLEGKAHTVEGTLVPDYQRYTWREITAPYPLIGQLLGEQLADELAMAAADIVEQ